VSERKGSGVFTAGRTGEGGVAADPMFWVILLGWFFAACWAVHLHNTPMAGGVLWMGVLGDWRRLPPTEKHPVAFGVDLFLLMVGLSQMGAL